MAPCNTSKCDLRNSLYQIDQLFQLKKIEKQASNKVPYRTYNHILQVTKVLSGKSLEILQCNRFI